MLVFICEACSVRAPMAQAIAEHFFPDMMVDSAGVRSSYIHPMVRDVLEDLRIGHHSLRSKDLLGVELEETTHIIALCEEAELPRLPKRITVEHWGIPDPLCVPASERYDEFLTCRDTLIARIQAWVRTHKTSQ